LIALHLLATIATLPGGRLILVAFHGRGNANREIAARIGALVRPDLEAIAKVALIPQGAGFIATEPMPGAQIVESRAEAISALRESKTILVPAQMLVDSGPGLFQRIIEAATPVEPAAPVGWNPLKWPGWCWAVLVGLGLIVGGLVALAITFGPVLLWYDRNFLNMSISELDAVSPRLVPFLQHDRVTMSGTMIGLGVLYLALAFGGMRRGRVWARDALLISGAIGFLSVFYFLGFGFADPLHIMSSIVLLPFFVLAVARRAVKPGWTIHPDPDDSVRKRALWGQLILIVMAYVVFASGVVISVIGVTDVFVGSDLAFLGAPDLAATNPQLLPFVAHDRAGFGGALMSAAAAVGLLATWGWRRGEGWVWWSLLISGTIGLGASLAIHIEVGYVNFWHLAPMYAAVTATAVALALSRKFFLGSAAELDLGV
jgi:hypothetical protein